MVSVAVNPPKTPITKTTQDRAPATLPNVCKMPGPPAPFVPTPLPNCGQSLEQPQKTTRKVTIEGQKICVKGSFYMSRMIPSDMPSKPQGGGIISGAAGGKTEFAAPGSMNTKAEGKNIQLLGDAMTNNGSSKNTGATLPGNIQVPGTPSSVSDIQVKQALCVRFCAYLKKTHTRGPRGGWSRKPDVPFRSDYLEQSLGRNSAWAKAGVFFRRAFRGRAGHGQVTKPDACRMMRGRVSRCYDFKFPGDRFRGSQKMRQTKLAGGKKVIEISPKSCDC